MQKKMFIIGGIILYLIMSSSALGVNAVEEKTIFVSNPISILKGLGTYRFYKTQKKKNYILNKKHSATKKKETLSMPPLVTKKEKIFEFKGKDKSNIHRIKKIELIVKSAVSYFIKKDFSPEIKNIPNISPAAEVFSAKEKIYIMNTIKGKMVIWEFDGNKWKKIPVKFSPGMPYERIRGTFVEMEDSVYLFGGKGKHGELNDLWKFIPPGTLGEEAYFILIEADSSRPPAREGGKSFKFNDDAFYIIGGKENGGVQAKKIIKYSIKTNSFKSFLPKSFSNFLFESVFSAFTHKEKLYILAKGPKSKYFDLYVSDRNFNNLTRIQTQVPFREYFLSGKSSDGFYIFSGIKESRYQSDFWVYNFKKSKFIKLKTAFAGPAFREQGVISTIGDNLYIMGGKKNKTFFEQEVWKYNIKTKKFSFIPVNTSKSIYGKNSAIRNYSKNIKKGITGKNSLEIEFKIKKENFCLSGIKNPTTKEGYSSTPFLFLEDKSSAVKLDKIESPFLNNFIIAEGHAEKIPVFIGYLIDKKTDFSIEKHIKEIFAPSKIKIKSEEKLNPEIKFLNIKKASLRPDGRFFIKEKLNPGRHSMRIISFSIDEYEAERKIKRNIGRTFKENICGNLLRAVPAAERNGPTNSVTVRYSIIEKEFSVPKIKMFEEEKIKITGKYSNPFSQIRLYIGDVKTGSGFVEKNVIEAGTFTHVIFADKEGEFDYEFLNKLDLNKNLKIYAVSVDKEGNKFGAPPVKLDSERTKFINRKKISITNFSNGSVTYSLFPIFQGKAEKNRKITYNIYTLDKKGKLKEEEKGVLKSDDDGTFFFQPQKPFLSSGKYGALYFIEVSLENESDFVSIRRINEKTEKNVFLFPSIPVIKIGTPVRNKDIARKPVISGTFIAGRILNLYIDGILQGTMRVNKNGIFYYQTLYPLSFGDYHKIKLEDAGNNIIQKEISARVWDIREKNIKILHIEEDFMENHKEEVKYSFNKKTALKMPDVWEPIFW